MAWKGWEDVQSVEELTSGARAVGTKTGDRPRNRGVGPRNDRGVDRPAIPGAPAKPLHRPHGAGDRGSRRGARRVVVTEDRQVIEHALAKNTGTKGVHFQSRREALRYVGLLGEQDRGLVRNLTRQVRFALQCTNAAGLKETVTTYIADFVYEVQDTHCNWHSVVEDVKPRGGHREDAYLLKKKWFEAQYGRRILETH